MNNETLLKQIEQLTQLKKELAYEGMRYTCATMVLGNLCQEFGVKDLRDRLNVVRRAEGDRIEKRLMDILNKKGSFYGNPIVEELVDEEDDGTPA